MQSYVNADAILSQARTALRARLAVKKMTATDLAKEIKPSSPNMFTKFLGGGGIMLENFLLGELALGLSPGELLSASPRVSKGDIEAILSDVALRSAGIALRNGPSIGDVLRWFAESGGRIESGSDFAEYFDVYGRPTDGGIFVRPLRFGANSLATQDMGTRDTAEIARQLTRTNQSFLEASARSHGQVYEGRSIMDERECDLVFDDGRRINRRYARVLRKGQLEGQAVVLTFVEEI